jgi:taurine---2-oxoglutarate transaminase
MNLPYFITWCAQKNAPHFEVKGVEGYHFLTDQGKVLDISSVSMQASFGLRNNRLVQALTKQAADMPLASPKALFPLKERVSLELLKLSKINEGKVFYTVSGAEAIENAIKMARLISGRKVIGARVTSYHGATLGALSLTGDWRSEKPLTWDETTLRLPEPSEDPDATLLEKTLVDFGPEKVAGLCLETITGANGVLQASKKWWTKVQALCDQYGIFLILDEVVCGLYRTKEAFAFHHYGVRPHFVALAKSLSGGHFPLGAVITSKDIAKKFEDEVLPCGLTNYAHPIGLAIAEEVLKLIQEESFKNQLTKNCEILNTWSKSLPRFKKVKSVRQIGMLMAIETHCSNSWQEFIDRGLYLMAYHDRIILAPALNMPTDTLIEGMAIIEEYLEGTI